MTESPQAERDDAIVVVLPLSPSDTNPPLGPYLLKTCFERIGLSLAVRDLSIDYINLFKDGTTSGSRLLGDQDKDRRATHAARDHFVTAWDLGAAPPLHLPCSSDAVLGMHFRFEDIENAVRDASRDGSFWNRFFGDQLFSRAQRPPRVLGISIMGPC